MGFDLPVFCVAGIQDALSPMPLATAGIFAFMLLFLRQSAAKVVLVSSVLFMAVLVSSAVLCHFKCFGSLEDPSLLLGRVKWAFLVLGIVLCALGFVFLSEGLRSSSGGAHRFAAFIPTPSVGCFAGALLSLILVGGLAFLTCVWPVNYQVLIQGEMAFMPGMFFYSLGAFCLYEVLRNGAVLFVFLFFILACRRKSRAFLRPRKALMANIVSAAYFAAGLSLIFFFYVAATKPWL